MKENELKIRFDSGGLRTAIITPAPMMEGYHLAVTTKDKSQIIMELKRGDMRVFRSIDAAVKTAKRIGFREVLVVLDIELSRA